MWDGVVYVDPTHNPIIHEGLETATVVVTNAGPAGVSIKAWGTHRPDTGDPEIQIQLWPGNTRSVSARLVRAQLLDNVFVAAPPPNVPPARGFAAIAWRILP
jgi:hypothetical protein